MRQKDEVSPRISQTPMAITLLQNSTAELHCSVTSEQPFGLYLKRLYAVKREVLYLSLPSRKETLHDTVKHRLSVTGTCCDFTLRLSQLQVEDTDGYICEWLFHHDHSTAISQPSHKQANETIIIIRDGDPQEDCSKHRTADQFFRGITFTMGVTTLIICSVAMTWRIRQWLSHHYSSSQGQHRHRRP
ncbi:uncharacterized protein LOC143510533 isoform X2 [Brachyhypopomus gauderio]|uniref:uncharacterized protein LOC143510533 isoform X2 n=1 Tax=Brachyhypopomus gauderio TaxID=698409 RepID=UPI0040417DD0